MQLAKFHYGTWGEAFGAIDGAVVTPLQPAGPYRTLSDVLEADDPQAAAASLRPRGDKLPVSSVELLAPIDQQEVWAAGVTYRRSRTARMEESQGAARFYDLVYEAPRPELFFKANPHRVAGPQQPVRIRADAAWNVPEPELAIVLNSRAELVGFTVGNDMSSRDIEGENPLYLPQAKVYDGCCALGPWITLAADMPLAETIGIRMVVRRQGKPAFDGSTTIAQMARTFDDLIAWLVRESSFPMGVVLLTGTGIVPSDDFTLQPGDVVEIDIDGIGTLINPVARREPPQAKPR
jgi:2-dehydro-3-deoxy-D-arabinonate dehydratase